MGKAPVDDKFVAAFDIYSTERLRGSGLSTAGGFVYRREATRKTIEGVTSWLNKNVVKAHRFFLDDFEVVAVDRNLNTTRCSASAWMAKHG